MARPKLGTSEVSLRILGPEFSTSWQWAAGKEAKLSMLTPGQTSCCFFRVGAFCSFLLTFAPSLSSQLISTSEGHFPHQFSCWCTLVACLLYFATPPCSFHAISSHILPPALPSSSRLGNTARRARGIGCWMLPLI